jgi:hypothetical protein
MPRRRKDGNTDFGTGSITADYRGGEKLDDMYRVQNFTEATYVQGETLRRFWARPDLHASDDKTLQFFLVYSPSQRQLEFHCDKCVARHKMLNLACSMNKHQPTQFIDITLL